MKELVNAKLSIFHQERLVSEISLELRKRGNKKFYAFFKKINISILDLSVDSCCEETSGLISSLSFSLSVSPVPLSRMLFLGRFKTFTYSGLKPQFSLLFQLNCIFN